MTRKFTPWILGVLFLIIDIVTKDLIVKTIPYGGGNDYLGGFLRITLIFNDGGVFGILRGHKTMFLVISILVLCVMIGYYIYEKNRTFMFSTAMSLIFSGALGNILDRMVPGRPGVVDFISVGVDGVYRWPAFNIADSAIVVGAFLLFVVFYRAEKERKAAG